MIAVTSELRAKSGRQEELEQHLGRLAAQVRDGEPGCRFYLVARSQHDPLLYLTFERYEGGDALAAHSHTEHYTSALPTLMDCLAEPPRVALFDEVGGTSE